jgi:hypothetical protein
MNGEVFIFIFLNKYFIFFDKQSKLYFIIFSLQLKSVRYDISPPTERERHTFGTPNPENCARTLLGNPFKIKQFFFSIQYS